MAYSGLDTLFQNLGPATAGMAAGYREREARDTQQLANMMEQERIRKAQQEYEQSGQKFPFTLEQLRLGNSKTEAEIPGIQADSSMKGTNATRAAAALQDNIDLDKSNAKTSSLKNIAEQHQQYEKVLGALGAHTAGIPAAAQPAAILSYLQSSGYDMEAPQIKNLLSRVSSMKPEDLQKAFAAEKKWAAEHTPAFLQAVKTGEMQKESHLEGARIQGQNQARVEQMGIDAGKYARRGGGGGGKDFITNLTKAKVDERLGFVEGILASGISPETKEPLTEVEKMFYESMREKDHAVVNGKFQSRSQPGVFPSVDNTGKVQIQNKVPPSIEVNKAPLGTAENPIVLTPKAKK